ncbi:galanin peptide [Sigmodon hispidus]
MAGCPAPFSETGVEVLGPRDSGEGLCDAGTARGRCGSGGGPLLPPGCRFRSLRPLGLGGGGAERVTRQLPRGINSLGSAAPAADTSSDPRASSHRCTERCGERPARLPHHAQTDTPRTCTRPARPAPSHLLKVPRHTWVAGRPCPCPCPSHSSVPITRVSHPDDISVHSSSGPQTSASAGCADGVNSSILFSFQMARGSAFLLAWLLMAVTLSAALGFVMPAKEKRGWTLNSAGYLLGPHAIDNHRSFSDKHGLTGKRELQLEVDQGRPGNTDGPLPDSNIVRTIMEFLSFLHLKEAGALDNLPRLPVATSSEDLDQS